MSSSFFSPTRAFIVVAVALGVTLTCLWFGSIQDSKQDDVTNAKKRRPNALYNGNTERSVKR